MGNSSPIWETVIVGAGLAGLSAAIYLGRAKRRTLVVHSNRSMAVWEPDVQNYLGFPNGIDGEKLLSLGQTQANKFGAEFAADEITGASRNDGMFVLEGRATSYRARRVLLATGIFHLPPEIPRVSECLGHSMFFCKDCDGYRVQGKAVAIVGANNEAVEYALGMLVYSPRVVVVTNGRNCGWDETHAAWLREYEIPFYTGRIVEVDSNDGMLNRLQFETGPAVLVDALFTTRGDIYHNKLASNLGARLDSEGQVVVDLEQRTTVRGLYAAGCITPANCQMIIAAGQGATAAQAINRDLFEESLATHQLRCLRDQQLEKTETEPAAVLNPPPAGATAGAGS